MCNYGFSGAPETTSLCQADQVGSVEFDLPASGDITVGVAIP